MPVSPDRRLARIAAGEQQRGQDTDTWSAQPVPPLRGSAGVRPTLLRLAAYLMAGDAAWLRPSLASYYDMVDRIVVTYDAQRLGWTGRPVAVEECLEIVRALDSANKVEFLPGRFWRSECTPMENDTYQRQVSLAAAGRGVDWILQLDTDEIVLDAEALATEIAAAEANGREGLEYPARWMYASLGGDRYLEQSNRYGRLAAGYPGPVAVRAGARLRHARQGPEWSQLWRVDFRRKNTDPAHPRGVRVDSVVSADQAVLHLSWVRTEAELRAKGRSSSHADDLDWDRAVDRWLWHQRHPYLTVLTTPMRGGGVSRWLRIGRVPTARLDRPVDDRDG